MKKIFAILIIFLICAIGKTATDSNNIIVPDSNSTAVSDTNTTVDYQEKIKKLERVIESQRKTIEKQKDELVYLRELCSEAGIQVTPKSQRKVTDSNNTIVPDSNSTAISGSNTTKTSPAVQNKIYKEGDTVNIGYTSYLVSNSFWSAHLSNNPYLDEKPDATFLVVGLVVRNNDTKSRSIPPFTLIDENGAEYETSSKATFIEGTIGILDSLNPNVQKKGLIVFDVPTNNLYKLKVSGGYWSGESALIKLSPRTIPKGTKSEKSR